jgi:predicted nucleic acid-binding Zn ribbon protein
MPIYEYRCENCTNPPMAAEELRSIADRLPGPICITCSQHMELDHSVSSFVMDPAVSVKPLRRG